ncbi:lysylphosphatidylglycerol synthase transmembrane domain-containing protein [Zhaonella formicivorans]|uniref:lysylphosphatidylglycerol synthase transmembrane domain-containing protein n=1 Tax=Zhaonella formicivorans TaxID=2528593 RepID=UPI001D11E95E|nr:lysylphosphatidylglycerol synthase transmembrane domain-containing protein [Zhaonella formicivorans]
MKNVTKKHKVIIFKFTISLALIAWLVMSIEWAQVAVLLSGAKTGWIIVAFLWVIVSVLVSAYKWQLVGKAAGLDMPFKVLWQAYWAGLFFNNFLPSSIGGDALRIYWSGKYANDLTGATASVAVERILATLGLSLLALLAIPFAGINVPNLALFFLAMVLLSLLLLFIILYPKMLDVLTRLCKAFPRCVKFLECFSSHGKRMRKSHIPLFKALAWSVVFQFCVVMVNYSLFMALNITQVNLVQACVLIPATSVAAMIPIGINGYGTREGAYVALFSYLGVTKAGAMTASVLFALVVSMASLWGGWIWLKNGHVKGRANGEKYNAGESCQLLCERV